LPSRAATVSPRLVLLATNIKIASATRPTVPMAHQSPEVAMERGSGGGSPVGRLRRWWRPTAVIWRASSNRKAVAPLLPISAWAAE
jgi:hypothetical protein